MSRKVTAILRIPLPQMADGGRWQRNARVYARFSSSAADRSSELKKARADPTAKRPNRLCDPYGQGGKPLDAAEVENMRSTIHADWKLETVDNETSSPLALKREFVHPDFLSGTRFLHSLAAVAQINAHFPSLLLERQIVKKNWRTVSVVRCNTIVLGGLSTHDFHLAMVRSFAYCLFY
jgi:pterin-4a-carbinolamine dehydratase